MGVSNHRVDNSSSGGIFCGINENGRLKKYAYNKKLNHWTFHPTTGVFFENYSVPCFDKCVTLAKQLAFRFLNSSRLISWDLAVSSEGEPILVEVNLCWGDIDFHQITNGPLFGSLSEAVIREVSSDKTGRRDSRLYRII